MTRQDLEKLSREELEQLVLRKDLELESLRRQLSEQQIADKGLAIGEPAELKEVRARLGRIFDEAEAAITQYKDRVQRLDTELEATKQIKLTEAEQKAEEILGQARRQVMEIESRGAEKEREAERQAETILAAARQTAETVSAEAETVKARAKQEADAYWSETSRKLQAFLDAHAGLREMLGMSGKATDG